MAQADSNVVAANYTAQWRTLNDFAFEPQIIKEWYQRYGKGFYMLDFLRMAGNTRSVAGEEIKLFEDGAPERLIKLADLGSGVGIATSAAKADITFKVDTGDYNANNENYIRENDTFYIPQEYFTGRGTPVQYIVYSSSGSTNDITYTAKPLGATSAVTLDVPAGTELKVGANIHARGTGQPQGRTISRYQKTFRTGIFKESLGFEGGTIPHRSYKEIALKGEGAGTGIFDEALVKAEFDLDSQEDSFLFLSEENTNDTLIETSSFGGDNLVRNTKGYWNHLDSDGQDKSFVGSWSMADFDDILFLFESQGVTDTEAAFCYGSRLGLQIENSGLDFTKEFSGGSDLIDNYSKLGIKFKTFEKNGVQFICQKLASFSNPNGWGADAYNFTTSGFILPMGEATMTKDSKKVQIPNLTVGYLNHGKEDRTRVLKTADQMSGITNTAMGDKDGMNIYMLSEPMLIAAQVNKHIKVTQGS